MDEQVLYHSKEYTVYSNKVIQGKFSGVARHPHSLVSNYVKLARNCHSRGVMFKFSLNGRDNELPPYIHHYQVLYPEHGYVESPVIRFGEQYHDQDEGGEDALEPDTSFKIKLDLSPVLKAFEEQGYYEVFNGERLYKEDFTGVYVAGNAAPLSWDFENLAGREEVPLIDKEGNGIYEITILLNETVLNEADSRQWELKEDVSGFPQYQSDHVLIDALYNLSLEEIKLNIRPDNAFMAGEEWYGVWTRDISYSILLSLAAIEPEISKNSLMQKVSDGKIIQDTGTGGSWPVSTDRTTWALAAWEVYKVTGEEEWLKNAFSIIKNTVEDDLKTILDPATGLFYGESSFLDWREQTYPAWMDSSDIYKSRCLGTNAVHYRTYRILEQMAEILGEPAEHYREIARKVKDGINKYLWVPEKGYYGQFLYGRGYSSLSPRAEALGEALTVLLDIADEDRQEEVIRNNPVVPFGCPSIFPQIPDIPPYHNNGIWPFVQAYWNWAAAKRGNEQALMQGLGAMYRQAALFLTNKENLVAGTGDYSGTTINSNRQLWSVAGNLAMVYRIFYGMQFEPGGLIFRPFVPEAYAGMRQLNNFRYRNAELKITLRGWGNGVREVFLDGQPLQEARISGDLRGKHELEIILNEENGAEKPYNLVPNYFTLPAPKAEWANGALRWEPVHKAVNYQVWRNGQKIAESTDSAFYPETGLPFAEYQVAAVDAGGYASFLSEPVVHMEQPEVYFLEMESFVSDYSSKAGGYNGRGYVVISRENNTEITLEAEVNEGGVYLLDFRYSNGNGPVHTDNKAAIRSLLKGNELIGTVVFPQRGEGAWSDWGWSNAVEVVLEKGVNRLCLALKSYSENMSKEENTAFLDQLRLIRIN